jgi:RNA polymerase sigma-70 factor (ECF subfamily)
MHRNFFGGHATCPLLSASSHRTETGMLRLIPFFTTEAQLVAALKRGESRAHKVVYDRFAGKMLAVCTRYCANRAMLRSNAGRIHAVFEKIGQFRRRAVLRDGFAGNGYESLMFLRRSKQWRQEISMDNVLVEPITNG